MSDYEEDMTAEEFDAAFAVAEPVEVQGHPVVVVRDVELMPLGILSQPTSCTFGGVVLPSPHIGSDYSPQMPGAVSGSRSLSSVG